MLFSWLIYEKSIWSICRFLYMPIAYTVHAVYAFIAP